MATSTGKVTSVALDKSWLVHLEAEFKAPYMQQLREFLKQEKQSGQVVYPPGPLMFNALNSTPFDQVKVVILGQDPYHGAEQAHGLSFSVPDGVKPPPSLVNMFKEIHADIGLPIGKNGNLTGWAKQGVLLLNATLSVRAGLAGSHQGQGWEQFTDRVIDLLNRERENLVFLLWGSYAQQKGKLIDTRKHCVLKAPHPSPLSSHRGFFGCKHFSQTNQWLLSKNLSAIDWAV